jgi:hypothetical protein
MKTCGGSVVYLYLFWPLALDGGEWSFSGPGHFIPASNELERLWKEVVWYDLRNYPGCNRCQGQDLKPRPAEYKAHY